jgi:hypothetical protein
MFAFPALEASTLLGVVVLGEIAVLLAAGLPHRLSRPGR